MNHACPHCQANLRLRYTPMQRDSSAVLRMRCPKCQGEIANSQPPHEATLTALALIFMLISALLIVLAPTVQPHVVAILIGLYALLIAAIKFRTRHYPRYGKISSGSHTESRTHASAG